MEYPKAFATNLYAPELQSLRRSSGEYGEPQLLRRRTGSGIDFPLAAHLDQGHFFDKFRKHHAPVSSLCSYEIVGTNVRCKLGDYARPGLFDPIPATVDSNMVTSACLRTHIEFPEAQNYSKEPHESSEAFRAASDGSCYSAAPAEFAATAVSPGAHISRTVSKLGAMDKFFTEVAKTFTL